MSEHDEQKALFEWADRMVAQGRLPELVNMFAIPNGAWTKNQAMAVKLKQEGLKKGVPDIFLAVTVSQISKADENKIAHYLHFSGLFIEMKFGTNKLSADQKEWYSRLVGAEYWYVICYSWIEAAREIIEYLGKDPSEFADVLG